MTVYTIALPKGGSGKTSTAAELAYHLAAMGRRPLAIDMDQQGNLTTRLGVTDDTEVAATTADVLAGEAELADAAIAAPSAPGVQVVCGTHELADIDERPPADIVTVLRDMLPTLSTWDDYVIDTPPGIGPLAKAALAAADVIIAPIECKTEAYDQLARLEGVVASLAKRVRPGQRIHWIVPTKYDQRRLLDREVIAALNERSPQIVTKAIRSAQAVADAFTAGMTITAYDPTSAVADDYRIAIDKITGRNA